jgi:hypothetical protein
MNFINRYMKKQFFIALVLLIAAVKGNAQAVPKGTEIQELVWVSQVYANAPNLSFSLSYSYADSLYPTTLLDSSMMTCKLSKGRSFTSNTEVEYLQGREFNVYVSKDDSLVMVSPAQDYKSLFKAPLLDPAFREGHVNGMLICEINDSTRKLCVGFRPESYYVNYIMVYDPRNGFVKSISFCTRNLYGMYDLPADHILKTTMTMTGYSTAPVEAIVFNENRYVYRLNGELFLQPEWEGFRLQR